MDYDPFVVKQPPPYPKNIFKIGEGHILEWEFPKKDKDAKTNIPEIFIKRQHSNIGNNRVFTSITEAENILNEYHTVSPNLFIFQVSRCGSTLLARALEADASNRVFLEPQAIFGLFKDGVNSENEKQIISTFRIIMRSFGLCHYRGQKNLIFKFSSPHLLHFGLIRKAFPNVPSLFLYRHPVEVIASLLNNWTPWMQRHNLQRLCNHKNESIEKMEALSHEEIALFGLESFFRVGLKNSNEFSRFLNYTELPEAIYDLHHEYFSSPFSGNLKVSLKYHSKWPGKIFKADSEDKRKSMPATLLGQIEKQLVPLFEKLENKRLSDL